MTVPGAVTNDIHIMVTTQALQSDTHLPAANISWADVCLWAPSHALTQVLFLKTPKTA